MSSRRQILVGGVSAVAALAAARLARPVLAAPGVVHTEAEWRALLTPDQYLVLREEATERPFTSPLNDEHRAGIFHCAGCDQAVFSSDKKFESGTGWPSFWEPIDGGVGTREDTSYGMIRTEVHCSLCEGHLGHVFNDGPQPTGLRYCMNGIAMTFVPA